MEDYTTIPNSNIESNTNSTDDSQPSDIKGDKGFQFNPDKIGNDEPSISIKFNTPGEVEKVDLGQSENVKRVKIVGIELFVENGTQTVIFEGDLPNDGIVHNDKAENKLKKFTKVIIKFQEPKDGNTTYTIKKVKIYACIPPSTTSAPPGNCILDWESFFFCGIFCSLFYCYHSLCW
jgi:hypothetical protein